MGRNSEDRRAKRRAEANEKIARFARRIFGPDATEGEVAVVRAECRAANEILDGRGLTAEGVLSVGANAAVFANDILAKGALELERRACSAGCAWCCVLEISAWPAEVLQLAAWIETLQTPEQIQALIPKLRKCVETRDVENSAGRAPKVYCPLLAGDETCTVYAVRPSSCSAGMANDAGPCRAYAQGDDDAAGGFVVVPVVLAATHAAALVIADRGGPPAEEHGAPIDLHTGLAVALAGGAERTASRWLAREPVFAEARDRLVRRREILAALGPREQVFLRRSRD